MSKISFNKHISTLSKEELVAELQKLLARFPAVKDYYDAELNPEASEKLLKSAKAAMEKVYFTRNGNPGKASSAEARRIISDFEKTSVHPIDVIDLVLYRVEAGVRFTSAFGDIDAPFYQSLENAFEKACKLIKEQKLEEHYKTRCAELLNKSYHFGWGLYYGFSDSFKNTFG